MKADDTECIPFGLLKIVEMEIMINRTLTLRSIFQNLLIVEVIRAYKADFIF